MKVGRGKGTEDDLGITGKGQTMRQEIRVLEGPSNKKGIRGG